MAQGILSTEDSVTLHLCRDCNEPTVRQRLDGIWECAVCGRMFDGPPKPVPVKAKGKWKREGQNQTKP